MTESGSKFRAPRSKRMAAAGAFVAVGLLAACGSEPDPGQAPEITRGEKIYRNICVVCHNADPNLEGIQGPAIAHASREVLEHKVLRGEYPAGYAPTRDTRQMPIFAYLEPNLDDIEAFLASRKK